MLRKLTAAGAALGLGIATALGVAACGEDRGDVRIEGGTGTAKTGTGRTGTGKTGTSTAERQKTGPSRTTTAN
jgi:hypothetical protein